MTVFHRAAPAASYIRDRLKAEGFKMKCTSASSCLLSVTERVALVKFHCLKYKKILIS